MESGGRDFETRDCVIPLCTNEARWTRGPYAGKCEDHKLTPRPHGAGEVSGQRTSAAPAQRTPAGGLAARLTSLQKLAKDADRAAAKAKRAAERALKLKREADAIAASYRDALREAAA